MALQRDVMMTICRLADPPKTGKHANLSLRQVRSLMPRDSDPALLAALDQELAQIDSLAQPIRLWRDKNIAHTDVAAALGYTALDDVPAGTIDAVIERMGAFFVRVQRSQYPDVFRDPIARRSERSAKRLLEVLGLGVAAAPPWGEYVDDERTITGSDVGNG